MRFWLVVVGIEGTALILLGAYGAHGVAFDAETRRWFEVAWQYHALHTAALFVLAVAMGAAPLSRLARYLAEVAAIAFLFGTFLFSGSLYRLAFDGVTLFPMAAPIGGGAFILGWALIAVAGFAQRRD